MIVMPPQELDGKQIVQFRDSSLKSEKVNMSAKILEVVDLQEKISL